MKKTVRDGISAAIFMLPYGILYAVFILWPVIFGAYVSLFKWNMMGAEDFVGGTNYINMFTDSSFWEAMGHTFLFVVITTPIYIVFAFLFALLCNRETKFRRFYRTVYFLPYVLSVSVVSYLAVFMFQPYTGLVNTTLHMLGVRSEPFWLATPNLAWMVIMLITMWWTVGFNMVLYIAAMQDIPDELYEAASIDGASRSRMIFSVTIPMIRPTTGVILLLQVISSFKLFAQPYMITSGGPGTATRPIIQYIYETAFKKNNLGYASTMSYALFIVLLVFTLIFQVLSGRKARAEK